MKRVAPVVVFVFNRLDHTKRCLESLERNDLAKDSELYIFSDACPPKKSKSKVNEVREYVHHYAENSIFKNVTIVEAKKNKGLAKSVIEGVTDVIKKYKRVIVVEDDLVVADDFLEYMNRGLEYYKNDKRVWSITGYTDELPALSEYKADVYMHYRACSWGWGTWWNRWKEIDWEVKDYFLFKYLPFKRAKFNRGGKDLAKMLDQQMAGKLDSWAVRWSYTACKKNAVTVAPKKTKVLNNGFDGTGIHCGKRKKINKVLLDNKEMVNFIPVTLDKEILRQMKKFYK